MFPPNPEDLAEILPGASPEENYEEYYESQCGSADESQEVELYDGTLGVTKEFVKAHQSPVGQIQWNDNLGSKYNDPGNVSGARWCSGTMITKDLFLTAGHCFDSNPSGWKVPRDNATRNPIPPEEISTNMHVNFNYQRDTSGNLRTPQSFAISQLEEYRLGGIDYAIVRIENSPGRTFGFTPISPVDGTVGDMVCIMGHPAGAPKRIEAGPVTDFHDTRIGYNDIDTLGGNSGSGILHSPTETIVGVHTNGGCNGPMTEHNHGQRITSLITASPILSRLVAGMPEAMKKPVAAARRKIEHLRDNLSGARLMGTDLRGANLSNADLSNADLRNADLRGADLSNADLRGANLTSADVTEEELTASQSLERATMPDT